MRRAISVLGLVLLSAALPRGAQQTSRPGPQQQQPGAQRPSRDTSAQQQKDAPPAPTGKISGRVIAADNGRPVKRARVFVTAAELPGGRGVLTDDAGAYELTELPAGRYSLTVSKSGFISLAYGQRRPLQAGTPLQLGDGEQLKGVEFRLPRGGVISGRVFDEDGEPVAGAMVRIMRYQYLQGERRLTPAGTGQTDDRGQYRVWGLMPGDYYVNALTRLPGLGGRGFGALGPPGGGPGGGAAGFPGGGRGGRGGGPGADVAAMVAAVAGGNVAAFFQGGADDQEQVNYAPTYYPSATSVTEARAVTVGVSQEVMDINVSLQLVRTAHVAGRVMNPDGTPTSAGNVNLMADGPAAGRGAQFGANYGGRIQWDGSFTIASVPPGRYMLRARGDDSDPPQFGVQPLSVDGSDIADVTLVLSAGATITGTVTFQPGSAQLPDLTQIRIGAPSTDQAVFGPQPNARVDKDGHFTLSGVSSGPHLIRSNGNTRGWVLKSVTLDGRDITDTPLDVRAGQTLSNMAIVFTDKLTEVSGTITTESGTPMPDYTVLAFPTDPSLWRPQARQIMTARPDQTGKYRIRGLPANDYYIVTVDPTEQGEWFDPTYLDNHRAGAARLTLAEGDVKTQDFRVIQR